MSEPTYRQALSFGWELAWRHKNLWILGLFAALLGHMGIIHLVSELFLAATQFSAPNLWLDLISVFSGGSVGLSGFGFEQVLLVLWLIALLLGTLLVLAFISTASQGALIHAAAKFSKRSSDLPPMDKSWHEGVTHFWKLFGLNIIKKFILGFMTLWVAWSALYAFASNEASVRAAFVMIFIIAALVGLVLSFLLIYAAGYVVVENYSFGAAIQESWRLFVKHPLVSLEMGVIMLIIHLVAAAAVIAGIYIVFAPALVMWFIAQFLGSSALAGIGVASGLLGLGLLIALIGAIVGVFTISVWTYLFMKMHGTGVGSRVRYWLKYAR